jgi:hypothetical protein
MRTMSIRVLYGLILLLAIAYGYDYASIRRRASAHTPGDPYDVVTYPHLLAIPEKGNKVEYALDAQAPFVTESCVHSLFPHSGYTPCWYVQWRAKSPTPMMIVFARWGGLQPAFF